MQIIVKAVKGGAPWGRIIISSDGSPCAGLRGSHSFDRPILRKEEIVMKNRTLLYRLVVLAMLIAVGVVISPILRVEGMCPMAHLINIVCAVLLGPYYAFFCAVIIGVLRMAIMGIPPLALTGAIFGAFLSGVFYRVSKGRLIFAVLGEIVGTGIIGAIVSYPVMTYLWGRQGLTWMFYVPSFICGTLIGGSLAFILLKRLAKMGILVDMQRKLGAKVYDQPINKYAEACGILAVGAFAWLAVKVIVNTVLKISSGFPVYLPWLALGLFVVGAGVYLWTKRAE